MPGRLRRRYIRRLCPYGRRSRRATTSAGDFPRFGTLSHHCQRSLGHLGHKPGERDRRWKPATTRRFTSSSAPISGRAAELHRASLATGSYGEVRHEPVILPSRIHDPAYQHEKIAPDMHVPSLY